MFPQSSGYEGPADSKAAWVISRKNGKEGRREKGSVARLSESEPLSECVTNVRLEVVADAFYRAIVTKCTVRSQLYGTLGALLRFYCVVLRTDEGIAILLLLPDAVNQETNQGANQAEPTQQQQQQQQQQL
ncbi:hypothetical protein V1477_000332 [Vespula maculifrons]|uniref:Uncharacterized protein n=1 Tax=Vespula maculifrons TaxID=7453 RepID=A0ABD2D2M3_VESMC